MIPWTIVQKGLYDWVSNNGAIRSIWGKQKKANRPDLPYISMMIASINSVGPDWTDIKDTAVPAPGAEIDFLTRGSREIILRLTCFTSPSDAVGPLMAQAVLNDVKTRRRQPSFKESLKVAGVGVARFTPVLAIDGITGTTFEPRATMDVFGFLSSEVVETGTYIQTVTITDQIPDPDVVFQVTIP